MREREREERGGGRDRNPHCRRACLAAATSWRVVAPFSNHREHL